MASFMMRKSRFLVTGPAAVASIYGMSLGPRLPQCSGYSNAAATLPNLKATTLPKKITVYQYKICPFCHRVKAYLDYLRIPYETVEVNPLTKGEMKFSEYKKVPVVVFDELQVNDSSPILDHVNKFLISPAGATSLLTADTEKWSDWSEKRLAVMLYPNITRNLNESWECFGYTSEVLEWNPIVRIGTRMAGAGAMMLANGKIKKKYGIVDERAELEVVLQEWTSAVGSKDFLHGSAVTLPDLMVYGVLRSIEGLSTWKEIMQASPALKAWYDRVQEVTPSCEMVKR